MTNPWCRSAKAVRSTRQRQDSARGDDPSHPIGAWSTFINCTAIPVMPAQAGIQFAR
jgi:hypothetical protein